VAESAEEIYRRAQAAVGPGGRLPVPPMGEWETFPFEGDIRVRELLPPEATERPRRGELEADCWRCQNEDDGVIWSDADWLVASLPKPSGLPVIVLLHPRVHVDIGDVDDALAAKLGAMLVRVERAVRRVEGIGRVHVCRWGDGSFHLHWWFLGRPARLPQLIGSFAAIWDDILPPTPEPVWRDNLATVARALAADSGRAHV
jgi:diadenosine tetraphosphate (Ap4A) HIT family hydrolase